MEAIYDLRKKIIEFSGPEELKDSLIKALAFLECQLFNAAKPEVAPSLEEIDLTMSSHRELLNVKIPGTAGPTRKMKQYADKDMIRSARRIDWIISYGKTCSARCDLAEAEDEEKRLRDLYLEVID